MCGRDDIIRIRHILDAARLAFSLAEEQTRETLDTDIKLALSLVRLIEIIGEAASRVGEDCRNQHPEIPWAAIKAMRNRLIHAYFDVDLDQIWNTVTLSIPALIVDLEKILPPEE
jgi:uncharacterized protein with HEPN domain